MQFPASELEYWSLFFSTKDEDWMNTDEPRTDEEVVSALKAMGW